MIERNVNEQVLAPTKQDSNVFENQLRPLSFDDYIGQKRVKSNLKIAIDAAKSRREALDHVLLHGAPGLGKTTLANIIAQESGVGIKVTSGPALDKPGDIASILSNLEPNDVLFIDEIHRLKPIVEEVLYTAMEDFGIDIVIGKGPSARSMRIDLKPFTLIGATTKLSSISSPMRDRFGNVFRLDFYSEKDIAEIILRSSRILSCDLDDETAMMLARCSRQTPRVANRLLKRVRDFADVKNSSIVNKDIVLETLDALGVDRLGLDYADRNLLEIIINKFGGGPVGLNSLAAAIHEEQATLEEIYEPFLIKLGMLDRTPRGRIATENAYQHLGIEF